MKVFVHVRKENILTRQRLNNNYDKFGLYQFFETDYSGNTRGANVVGAELMA